MSRASLKAKKKWHRRKRRSSFKRERRPAGQVMHGRSTFVPGAAASYGSIDVAGAIAAVNRLFSFRAFGNGRGKTHDRGRRGE